MLVQCRDFLGCAADLLGYQRIVAFGAEFGVGRSGEVSPPGSNVYHWIEGERRGEEPRKCTHREQRFLGSHRQTARVDTPAVDRYAVFGTSDQVGDVSDGSLIAERAAIDAPCVPSWLQDGNGEFGGDVTPAVVTPCLEVWASTRVVLLD